MPDTPEQTPEKALEDALPKASMTAWMVAGMPDPGPDPTYWERFAHGVRGVLNANGWDVVRIEPGEPHDA